MSHPDSLHYYGGGAVVGRQACACCVEFDGWMDGRMGLAGWSKQSRAVRSAVDACQICTLTSYWTSGRVSSGDGGDDSVLKGNMTGSMHCTSPQPQIATTLPWFCIVLNCTLWLVASRIELTVP